MAPADITLGGNKGLLPPAELGFATYIDEATKVVKAKYTDAVLIGADAQKAVSTKKRPYDLTCSARFRVQKTKMVTVSGDNKTVSSTSSAPTTFADIKDTSQITVDINSLVGDKSPIGNIDFYFSVTLFQWKFNPKDSPPTPDQPYFEFRDKDDKRIAIVGASDGKFYTILTA